MSFTKETSDQNKKMFETAEKLLAKKNATGDTVANQHPDIIAKMREIYSDIPHARITHQVAKALHKIRAQTVKSRRGGLRNPPGGRPPLPPDKKRQKHSPTLAPGTKELAQAIAIECGLDGWGYAIDELVKREAERLGIE